MDGENLLVVVHIDDHVRLAVDPSCFVALQTVCSPNERFAQRALIRPTAHRAGNALEHAVAARALAIGVEEEAGEEWWEVVTAWEERHHG